MELLPQSTREFGEESYWDKFFKQRGEASFEWYGSYLEWCTLIRKYVRKTDAILVVGCGNSDLSSDMYTKSGYHNITNIDISDKVVQQMKNLHEKDKPQMKWTRMDIMKLSFPDDSYRVVIDKGTLDAIMTDDSEKVKAKAAKMHQEIERVLSLGGRYICISLLQEHIIRQLLDWFPSRGWLVRIHKCLETENEKFATFMVVCTKCKPMANRVQLKELCLSDYEKAVNVDDPNSIVLTIRSVQQTQYLKHHLKKNKAIEGAFIELFFPGSCLPRYVLHIVDIDSKADRKFAVFIVPQGRETEWLFGQHEGQIGLAKSSSSKRLIVAHLQRDQEYPDLNAIQAELSTVVMDFAPDNLPPSTKVDFLSLGADIGQRKVMLRGRSDVSGDYVVEDVIVEDGTDEIFRRLVFLANRNIIQSEARLCIRRERRSSKSRQRQKRIPSVSRENNPELDLDYLSCQHHSYMIGGLAFLPANIFHNETKGNVHVLLIGLGGGGLATFISNHFKQIRMDIVDIDPEMLTIAKDWFGFQEDGNRVRVHICDGLDFIRSKLSMEERYDVVMFDVDSKDPTLGISCPPPSFLEQDILESVKSILMPSGIFVLNLACRNNSFKEEKLEQLRSTFTSCYTLSVPDEVNTVVYAIKKTQAFPKSVVEGIRNINRTVKENSKSSQKDEDLIDICEMTKHLQIK